MTVERNRRVIAKHLEVVGSAHASDIQQCCGLTKGQTSWALKDDRFHQLEGSKWTLAHEPPKDDPGAVAIHEIVLEDVRKRIEQVEEGIRRNQLYVHNLIEELNQLRIVENYHAKELK